SKAYPARSAGPAALIPGRVASDFRAGSRDFLATPGVLKLLVYRALWPRLCPQCALPFERLPAQGAQPVSWHRWAQAFAAAHRVDPASLRARNPAGCPACRRPQLPQLHGLAGRTVVAETLEPD